MKTSNVIVGVAVGCGVLLIGVVVAVVAFFSWAAKGPEGLEVSVEAPLRARLGEQFTVVVTVKDTSGSPRVLVDVDLAQSYLEGIAIESTTPPFKDAQHTPIIDTISHSFDLPIEAGGSTRVELAMVAAHEGDFAGDVDVCVDQETMCVSRAIRTIVAAE